MTTDVDPIRRVRDFIDERWAVIQPNQFPGIDELSVRLDEVTSREAEWFLASVTRNGNDPPLFMVEDDNKDRSDRCPPNRDGAPRRGTFFEKSGHVCSLRLETIVHMAAVARLRDEFGWPREHLIVESPDVIDESGRNVLSREALDILALEKPCAELPSKVTVAAARSRLAVEAKATSASLDRLLQGIKACRGETLTGHTKSDHKKCQGIDLFRPRLFLGVAAGETWRLFNVDPRDGRAFIGEQRDLDCLHFNR